MIMSNSAAVDPRDFIRDVADFPKPGIVFKDITPLLADPRAFQATIDRLAEGLGGLGIDAIVGPEARGFLFAAPLALRLELPFVPIRKPGKLPSKTFSHEYQLEYGSDRLEIHQDALSEGSNVAVVDDVLATGGTVRACCDLITKVGAKVAACGFAIELSFLNGREILKPHRIVSVITY